MGLNPELWGWRFQKKSMFKPPPFTGKDWADTGTPQRAPNQLDSRKSCFFNNFAASYSPLGFEAYPKDLWESNLTSEIGIFGSF